MNLFLIQVGKSTWVDPDAIQAIDWSEMSRCPRVLLDNGLYVLADNFKDMASAAVSNDAVAGTSALLALLQRAHLKRDQ